MLIPRQHPVAFKVEIKRDFVVISALKQSARGTRYLAGSVQVSRDVETKEEFERNVLAAVESLEPALPTIT